jgi:hypothetical protein
VCSCPFPSALSLSYGGPCISCRDIGGSLDVRVLQPEILRSRVCAHGLPQSASLSTVAVVAQTASVTSSSAAGMGLPRPYRRCATPFGSRCTFADAPRCWRA